MTSEYLKKPILTKKIQYKCQNGFAYTKCQMQGWRKNMEDATLYQEIVDGVYLFGVFDGHGGPEVANYVAQILPKQMISDPNFKQQKYSKALTSVFKKIDDIIMSSRGQEQLCAISKRLGTWNGEKVGYRAGTTAVVILMTKARYYVANIGDSRAVLSRSYNAVSLSTDHKPDLPQQKSRIEKAGGYVKNGRVNGALGLSRSFGDFEYKHFSNMPYEQQAVISVPEVLVFDRKHDDNFIILGCDGVWQRYVSNSQKMVTHIKQLRETNNDRKVVMDKLFNELVAKDTKQIIGCDNMSAILIELF